MQPLPSRAGSIDSDSAPSENSSPKSTNESSDKQSSSKDDNQKIVIAANKTLSLDKVFQRYKVHLEQTYSGKGWSYKGCCPFDDHNDQTPSFGYNPEHNVFHCFGCHRSGRTVDFIAIKEGRDKLSVAKEILSSYGVTDLEIDEINGFDYKRLKKSLLEYSQYVFEFKKRHNFSKTAVTYAKAVNWVIDLYLRNNSNLSSININNLDARLEKLKDQLDLFEEIK